VNPKLEAIAEEAGKQLSALIAEAADDIARGIEVAVEEAQANETEAKFSISFAVQLNLDRNTVTHRLAFATRHKFESVGSMPDPDQMKLPMGGPNE